MTDLERIIVQFETEGKVQAYAPFGNGHIHDSYKVSTEGNGPDYLLQRINTQVFQRVPEMMENIERVTQHMRNKLRKESDADIYREALTVIPTFRGHTYYIDETESYWRMYRFIEGTVSMDKPQSAEQVYDAGRVLGKFQRLMVDFPYSYLHETIPDFHDMKKRLRKFTRVVKNDKGGRLADAETEVKFVRRRKEEMKLVADLGKGGFLPQRVTHNDTKFNNLLFDASGKGLLWIDLDTVMPGYIHYDFGDAIRSLANSGDEDEQDLEKVTFNLPYFQAFTQGYMAEMEDMLTPIELIHLAFSAKMMTFIMGLRFLTDFLEGDVYYKTAYPTHNLVRCRAQFKLVQEMETSFKYMKATVEECMFMSI